MAEELFAVWSDKHREYIPVFLERAQRPADHEDIYILHFRGGDHHEEAVNKAEVLLGARGLDVKQGTESLIPGREGFYEYTVKEVI